MILHWETGDPLASVVITCLGLTGGRGGADVPGDHRAAGTGHDGGRVPKRDALRTWTRNSRYSRARNATVSDIKRVAGWKSGVPKYYALH
jgi:hypothetical protein